MITNSLMLRRKIDLLSVDHHTTPDHKAPETRKHI